MAVRQAVNVRPPIVTYLPHLPHPPRETMCQIWSGVALVLGPPLGCLVVPYGGVSSVFLVAAAFPLVLLLFAPKVAHLARADRVRKNVYGSVSLEGVGGVEGGEGGRVLDRRHSIYPISCMAVVEYTLTFLLALVI